MSFTGTVEVRNLDEMNDTEKIDEEIRMMLTIPQGTLPGSRGFGINPDYIDSVSPDMASDIAEDLDEQCETYIPEATVSGVEIESVDGGEQTLLIEIEGRDQDGDISD